MPTQPTKRLARNADLAHFWPIFAHFRCFFVGRVGLGLRRWSVSILLFHIFLTQPALESRENPSITDKLFWDPCTATEKDDHRDFIKQLRKSVEQCKYRYAACVWYGSSRLRLGCAPSTRGRLGLLRIAGDAVIVLVFSPYFPL